MLPPSFPTALCWARGPVSALWIFYTNTILQMSETEDHKKARLYDFIFHLQRKEVQERVAFIPLPCLRLFLHLPSVCGAASLYSCFIPSRFIHIQQSIISLKKREGESEREWESREKSGDCRWKWYFFFLHVLILLHLNRRCGKALGAPLYIAASLSSKAANRA